MEEELIEILPKCSNEDKVNDSRKNFSNKFDKQQVLIKSWSKLTWTCYYCNQKFNNYLTYKSHQDSLHNFVNADDAYYQCIDCDKQPFGYASFLNHVRSIHHDDLKLCCDICSETLLDYAQLSLHRNEHIETSNNYPAVYHCTLCEIVHSTEKELKNHIKLSHNFLHSVDKKGTNEKKDSKSSKTVFAESIQCKDEYHDTVPAFQCGKCVNNFASEIDLALHMRMHTEERSFPCKNCSESFSDKSSLKKHIQAHHEDRPYQCEKCEKSYKHKWDKQAHMRIHTGERPFQCKTCLKSFKDYSNFKRHERDHNDDRPYKCEKCEKTFKRKGDKNFHMRLHTEEQNSETNAKLHCEICSKNFSAAHFKVHMRIHTGERPFQCQTCQKGFTSKSILTRHLQTHNNDRPYKCDKCEKKFKRKDDKKVHMRIHTGERPFKCEICSKEYAVQQNLKVHIASQHLPKNDVYSCTICSKIFKNEYDLENHNKSCRAIFP